MSHRDRYLDYGGLGVSYRQVLRLWGTVGLIKTCIETMVDWGVS